MELLQLRYFKAVTDAGKVVSAAESLFISPPALSMSISRLEKELGMQLFDRSNNRIALNKQGKIFLRYVNQILTMLDCAQYDLQQSIIQEGHHVSVAVTTSNLWVDLIAAFSQEYPHITLSTTTLKIAPLRSSGLLPQYAFLLAEESDLEPDHAAELKNVLLFEDQPAIMVNSHHPLARFDSVDLSDLDAEQLLLPMQGHSLYERYKVFFEENNIVFPNTRSYSYIVHQSLVLQGNGVSLTTMRARQLATTGLCFIPIKNQHKKWNVRLYWRGSKPLTDGEYAFLDYIQEFYNSCSVIQEAWNK